MRIYSAYIHTYIYACIYTYIQTYTHDTITFLRQITTETIISLVKQVLQQHGALPIGEIGKQLQIKTGNSGALKTISNCCCCNSYIISSSGSSSSSSSSGGKKYW